MKTKHRISILQLRQEKKGRLLSLLPVPVILQGRETIFCLEEEMESDVESEEAEEEWNETDDEAYILNILTQVFKKKR